MAKSSIKILEEIGLREVSRKTYIELSYLKLMTSKDFSKLHRIKALGFVKIIQREYDIDMGDWVAEFEAYLQANSEPLVKKTDEVLEEHKSIDKRKKIYIAVSIAFLVFFTIFVYSFLRTRTGYVSGAAPASYNIITENTNEMMNSIIQENRSASGTQNNESTEADFGDKIDLDNKTAALDPTVILTTQENVSNETQPKVQPPVFKAGIYPHTELWVGIVDLNTFKKSVYLQESAVRLNLNKEQIVITGHGDFTLKVKGKDDKGFNPRERTYFIIGNETIKEITFDEFVTLNKGQSW